MIALPISHNGQVYELQPIAGYSAGRYFRLVVSREVVFNAYVDEEGSWDYDEATVEESLGMIEVQEDSVFAQVRHGFDRYYANDLNGAVAFLADHSKPCAHGDASQVDADHDIWECDECEALFVQDMDLTPQVLRYRSDVRQGVRVL